MCQLTSPSPKMVAELPRATGISKAPMSSGTSEPIALRPPSSGTRALGRASPVDRVKHEPDHLRAQEEQLRAVGQADEQIDAAEDSDQRDERRRRRSELALAVGFGPAQHQHRGA